MRRLMLTASASALFLFALGQPVQSTMVSDSAPPAFTTGTTTGTMSAENIPARIANMNVAQNGVPQNGMSQSAAPESAAPESAAPQNAANVMPANWYDGRPIVVVQHDMPPNIDLKPRPRIASDLAAALREPSFAIFATALMFLFGMAVFALRRILD